MLRRAPILLLTLLLAAAATAADDDACAGVPRNTLLAACPLCDESGACVAYDQDAALSLKATACSVGSGSDAAYCTTGGGAAKTCEFQCFPSQGAAHSFDFYVTLAGDLGASTARETKTVEAAASLVAPFESNTFVSHIGPLHLAPSVTEVLIAGGHQENVTRGTIVDVTVDASTFAAAPQLTSIKLLNMDLGTKLHDALASVPTGLTTLSLRNTQLTAIADDALSKLQHLQSLTLSQNSLTSVTTRTISLPELTSLDLSDNELTSFDVSAPKLVELDLSGNQLASIPSSVFALTNLRVLNLGNNRIASPVELTLSQAAFLIKVGAATAARTGSGTPITATGGVAVEITNDQGGPWTTTGSTSASSTSSSSSSSSSGANSTVVVTALATSELAVEKSYSSNAPPVDRNSSSASDDASDATGDGSKTISSTTYLVMIVVGVAVIIVGSALGLTWHKRRRDRKILEIINDASYTKLDSDDTHSTGTRSIVDPDLPVWADSEMVAYRLHSDYIEDVHAIGTGSSGVVWLVKYRAGSRQLAAKRLTTDGRPASAERVAKMVTEIKIAASLSHPNVVQFFGVAWTADSDLQALFEFFPRGDLCAYLAKTDALTTPWLPDKLQLAIDMIDALVYTHSFDPPLLHRDLKSRNVLLGDDMRAKLGDFGCSRSLADKEAMAATKSDAVGTGRWLAPEVLAGSTTYDTASDIYSFGVLLCELDTHQLPYADLEDTGTSNTASEAVILQRVAQGELQPTLSDSCPAQVRHVAEMCLAFHATHRPSAIQVAFLLRQILHPTS